MIFKVNYSDYYLSGTFTLPYGPRAYVDSLCEEYRILTRQVIDTQAAWIKIKHMSVALLEGFDLKTCLHDEINRQIKRYPNEISVFKINLAAYIVLLRTGVFNFYADEQDSLAESLDFDRLLDLLFDEIKHHIFMIYKNKKTKDFIIEFSD